MTTCPSWCKKSADSHTPTWSYHSSEPVKAGGAYAILVGHSRDGDRVLTELMVATYDGPVSARVAVETGNDNAEGLAALMGALGHKQLATAIRKVAALAAAEAKGDHMITACQSTGTRQS